MKVIFINPPSEKNITRRWRCAVEQGHYLFPPLELMYMATTLREWEKAEVEIHDSVAERIGWTILKQRVEKFSPDILVFIPGFEGINQDIKSILKLKSELSKKIRIGTFGFLPSQFPKEILELYDIDFILMDEPELPLVELYRAYKNGKSLSEVLGIAYKQNRKVSVNAKMPELKDLDKLPIPDKSLIKNELYFSGFPDKHPFTTLLSARGCTYRCSYCIRSIGDALRQRSPKNAVDEIEDAINNHSIKTVRILDDTFTANKRWTLEFCREIQRRNLKFDWTCLSRLDTVDEETLIEMRKAGCNRMLIGVETASKRLIKYYDRYARMEAIHKFFSTLKKLRIQSFAFFLIGGPEETQEEFEESVNLAKEINPDFITINMVRVYPGTTLYNKLKSEGKVKFSIEPFESEFETKLPEEQIRKNLFSFYRRFYFRTSYIIPHIPLFLRHPAYAFGLLTEYIKWEIKNTNFKEGNKSKSNVLAEPINA